MHRSTLAALALLVLSLGAARGEPPAGEVGAIVRVGSREVITLRESVGGMSAVERAMVASVRIESAMPDPACGPEGWGVIARDSLLSIRLCDREILAVGAVDTLWEGGSLSHVAAQWTERLREAYAAEKQAVYSRSLLRRAITGLLIPLAFLAAIVLVRLTARRLRLWLLSAQRAGGGLRIGPIRLMSGSAERKVTAQIVLLLQWLAFIVLGYFFVIFILEQFPRTASWGVELADPLSGLAKQVRRFFVIFLPRLILALIVIGLARLVMRLIKRIFEQVRKGDIRAEPFLSVETAGPAEMTAQWIVVGLAILAIVFLIPGMVGTALLVALGLAGLAFALGAQDGMANAFGGLVIIYARPIRTGQRIRTGGYEGIVNRKGLLHVRLQLDNGRIALLPNRWFLRGGVEVLGQERAVILRIVVETIDATGGTPGSEAAMGLIRHAAAAAGLKREEGEVRIRSVEGGRVSLTARWPVASGETAGIRSSWIEALLEKAPGMHLRVVSARSVRSGGK